MGPYISVHSNTGDPPNTLIGLSVSSSYHGSQVRAAFLVHSIGAGGKHEPHLARDLEHHAAVLLPGLEAAEAPAAIPDVPGSWEPGLVIPQHTCFVFSGLYQM